MYGLFTGCPKPGFVQIWDVYGKNMGFYAKSAGYYGKNTGFYGLSFFSGHLFLSKSVKVQKLCGKSMDIVSIMNFEGLLFRWLYSSCHPTINPCQFRGLGCPMAL